MKSLKINHGISTAPVFLEEPSLQDNAQLTNLDDFLRKVCPAQPRHPCLVHHGLEGAPSEVYCGTNAAHPHAALVARIRNSEGATENIAMLHIEDGEPVQTMLFPEKPLAGAFARIGKPPKECGFILVTADWTDGMALQHATGLSVAVAFLTNNLAAVCDTLIAKYPSQKIILCAGSDGGLTPLANAMAVAFHRGIPLAIPPVSTLCFSALYERKGKVAVKRCVDAATAPTNATPSEESQHLAFDFLADDIERLATLMEDRLAKEIRHAAKMHGLPKSFIADLVSMQRQSMDIQHVTKMSPTDPSPWPQAVDGEYLIRSLLRIIKRFTVLPPHLQLVMALWIVFSYTINAAQIAPILAIISATKRCGKTTLLGLLERLVLRPLSTSNITTAALFRSIERFQPTLLIDEGDTFISGNEDLRGVLNSGHSRNTAFVVRTVSGEPESFATWCAKVIAMIGTPPDTILDRALLLHVTRKKSDETVESLRHAPKIKFRLLQSMMMRWSNDHFDELRKFRPPRLDLGSDRLSDNCEPLLAIAACLGPTWYDHAIAAATTLAARSDKVACMAEQLLLDTKAIFEAERVASICTADLIAALIADKEKAWCEYSRGKPITPRDLAQLLKRFGIASNNVRIGTRVAKGFTAVQFEDAFARYCADS